MLRLAKAVVTATVVLYSIPLTAWLFFRFWKGESWPTVGLLNAVGIWWFAPLLVLLPAALLVRARQASFMGFLMVLPAFLLYGAEFTPHVAASLAAGAPTLRVLSLNALVSNSEYDQVEALVREEQPDILAIQELSHHMAHELNTRIGEEYPYQLLYPWSDPRGIGLWSRYPLQEGPAFHQAYWERWAQTAVVEVAGKPVYLVNVHLWPIGVLDRAEFAERLAQQHRQVRELRDLVTGTDIPVLVVGDFNASPTNDTYALLDEVLDDVWRQTSIGPGFTWPAREVVSNWVGPFIRIDYIWTRGNISPVEMRVLEKAGSDHLPVVADFVLPPEP